MGGWGGGGRTFPRIMPRLERSPCACSKPTSRFEVIFIFNGRINGTGLRVTRRESLLLQIPVGSRPLSKLNPACASITISRGGGQFSKFFQFISFYRLLLLLLLLFFQINFYSFERKKKKEERILSIVSSCVCIYISRYLSPVSS